MITEYKLVIGAGSGRCGTTSFAHFLNAQKGAIVSHETFTNRIPWDRAGQKVYVDKLIRRGQNSKARYFGDVALQWTNNIPYLVEKGAKVVILKRERDDVVRSFLQKSRSRNNWQPPGAGGTPKAPWFNCFPKFDGPSKAEALGQYWDHIYQELVPSSLDKYGSDNILVVYVDALNNERGLKKILDWIGIDPEDQAIKVGIHRNKARNKNGQYRRRRVLR